MLAFVAIGQDLIAAGYIMIPTGLSTMRNARVIENQEDTR